MEYTPYRYVIHEPDDPIHGHRLVVMTRGDNKLRRQFTFPVYPQLAVQIAGTNHLLDEIKEILSTPHIRYDQRANLFIIRADTKIDRKDFVDVKPIPLTVSTALWNLNRQFFGKITETTSSLDSCLDEYPFISLVWHLHTSSEGHVGWISYHRSNEARPHLITSVGMNPKSERDIITEFLTTIADVDIEAGTPDNWSLLLRRARMVGATLPANSKIVCSGSHLSLDLITLEHVDIFAFAQRFFPHLSFRDLNELYIEFFEVGTGIDPGPIDEWMLMMVLRARELYKEIMPRIFHLASLSLCNLGDLTRDDIFRDILRPYNYALSIRGTSSSLIPAHFTSIGKFRRPLGYLLGTYLQHLLLQSEDHSTSELAMWIEPIKEYSWIMRPIFCLENLSPEIFGESFVAFHNDVLYATEELRFVKHVAKWSLLVCPIPGELIRVSLTEDPEVFFSYQGNSAFCIHPYTAIRTAIQMYLTYYTTSGGSQIPSEVVATTVSLDSESTAISRVVTHRNYQTYKSLLTESEDKVLKDGGEVKLRLWKSDNGESRDRTRFYRLDYIREMSNLVEILAKV